MKHSQHKPLTTIEDNTRTINETLQKQSLLEGKNIQALSPPDCRSWVFTPKKVRISKTMSSSRSLPWKSETRYSRSTTKNAVHLCFHTRLLRLLLQVAKHPTHKENLCRIVLIATSAYPPLPNSDRSHHNFLHLCQFHENLYVHMSHGTDKRRSFTPHPHEASQAEDKGVRDRINSILEIQWNNTPTENSEIITRTRRCRDQGSLHESDLKLGARRIHSQTTYI
jgi:hypothetical protein